MESPPSCSTRSEAFILSDDSGLLLTSGSISSGSMSGGDSPPAGRVHTLEYQSQSDCDVKSLSQTDSLDDIMCGENFNTLKKGPNWNELSNSKHNLAIDPPPEFQDIPPLPFNQNHSPLAAFNSNNNGQLCRFSSYWPSCRNNQFRNSSFGVTRLSSSHNSLTTGKSDDSSFITQAVSHDTLTTDQISDLYNVPFDSDVYALPVDMIRPLTKYTAGRLQRKRKRKRNTIISCHDESCNNRHSDIGGHHMKTTLNVRVTRKMENRTEKRHNSVPNSTFMDCPIENTSTNEPIHMTLQEVRYYLETLYASNSDHKEDASNQRYLNKEKKQNKTETIKEKKNTNVDKSRNEIVTKRDSNIANCKTTTSNSGNVVIQQRRCSVKNFPSNLKQTICNLFRFRSSRKSIPTKTFDSSTSLLLVDSESSSSSLYPKETLASRALPPLPANNNNNDDDDEDKIESRHGDFTSSIRKVKDYGWYWGPISSESAEKILSNEPDGSFIVRDSSDDHYIFSLTFKLNSGVRHVRIEHDQGNFSFGSCTKFKSHTIIEFIENAVEHSRSGRYLFFLHRRPVLGPMRVQLLHPVSRFKQIQSLQHMCRFVILKYVRKDLISSLPLPRRIIDYLSTPHYYSELLLECDEEDSETTTTTTQHTHL